MLAEETGETAVISRRVGLAAVCLHQQESAHALRVALEPGIASPLDVGAIALVLLAYAPADVQDEVLGSTGDAAVLTTDLETVRTDGIARSEGLVIPGVVTIAVPVMRDDGIVAALAVLAPEARATLAWRTRSSRVLVDAAGAISRALRPAGEG
jgi:DNA-binding IclR family transcriptional regulator